MQLSELKQKLMKKEIDNLYIFSGEEFGIMEKYISSISKLTGKQKKCIDSVKELFQATSVMSLMNTDSLYIVKDDKDFVQSKSEKKWSGLEKIKNKNIILVYSNIDKRGKFYKKYKDKITEFEKLSTTQLLNYVYKEINLKTEFAEQLISACGNSYIRMMLEIDKIKTLMDVKKCDCTTAYLTLVNEGQIYKEPQALIFDLSDAVLMRNEKLAFNILNILKQLKTAPILMLSIIYKAMRDCLMVQATGKPTQAETGLTGWQIQQIKNKVGNYEIGELIENLKIVQDVDILLKSGKIDSNIVVEYTLLKIL